MKCFHMCEKSSFVSCLWRRLFSYPGNVSFTPTDPPPNYLTRPFILHLSNVTLCEWFGILTQAIELWLPLYVALAFQIANTVGRKTLKPTVSSSRGREILRISLWGPQVLLFERHFRKPGAFQRVSQLSHNHFNLSRNNRAIQSHLHPFWLHRLAVILRSE